jgi:hypothetical protein
MMRYSHIGKYLVISYFLVKSIKYSKSSIRHICQQGKLQNSNQATHHKSFRVRGKLPEKLGEFVSKGYFQIFKVMYNYPSYGSGNDDGENETNE